MHRALYPEQNHPDLAQSLHSLGISHKNLGEYDEAKRHYEEGLTMSQGLDPRIARTYIDEFNRKLDSLRNEELTVMAHCCII